MIEVLSKTDWLNAVPLQESLADRATGVGVMAALVSRLKRHKTEPASG